MPFVGILDEERVIPEGVENGTDIICPECGEEMFPWGPAVDGTARHFKHHSDRDCATIGGESATHRKLKSIAVSKLQTTFEERAVVCEPEVTLDAPTSTANERRADALVRFDKRDPQLGKGLIVEVQYKNKGKDKSATELDYLAQDYSVVWVGKEHYHDNELTLSERSLRHMARHAANKHFHRFVDVPNSHKRPCDKFLNLSLSSSKVQATIPPDYYDKKARQLWEEQSWESLFTPAEDQLSQIERSNVPVEIDIAPFLKKDFWRRAWMVGRSPQQPNNVVPCDVCGEMISSQDTHESVSKMLKFHAKREHKKILKRAGTYSQFIKKKHAVDLGVSEQTLL